jgi:hypothetical protein
LEQSFIPAGVISMILYRFSSNVPFLELDYAASAIDINRTRCIIKLQKRQFSTKIHFMDICPCLKYTNGLIFSPLVVKRSVIGVYISISEHYIWRGCRRKCLGLQLKAAAQRRLSLLRRCRRPGLCLEKSNKREKPGGHFQAAWLLLICFQAKRLQAFFHIAFQNHQPFIKCIFAYYTDLHSMFY